MELASRFTRAAFQQTRVFKYSLVLRIQVKLFSQNESGAPFSI